MRSSCSVSCRVSRLRCYWCGRRPLRRGVQHFCDHFRCLARASVRVRIELAGHALGGVYAREGCLHLPVCGVEAETLEPVVRAAEQAAGAFQMLARLAEVDAVDRHARIEDRGARTEQLAPPPRRAWHA